MKNIVTVDTGEAAIVLSKLPTILNCKPEDRVEISSDGSQIVIRKVTCALCGNPQPRIFHGHGQWVCQECADKLGSMTRPKAGAIT